MLGLVSWFTYVDCIHFPFSANLKHQQQYRAATSIVVFVQAHCTVYAHRRGYWMLTEELRAAHNACVCVHRQLSKLLSLSNTPFLAICMGLWLFVYQCYKGGQLTPAPPPLPPRHDHNLPVQWMDKCAVYHNALGVQGAISIWNRSQQALQHAGPCYHCMPSASAI